MKNTFARGKVVEERGRKDCSSYSWLRTDTATFIGAWQRKIHRGEGRCDSCMARPVQTGEHLAFRCKDFADIRRQHRLRLTSWGGFDRFLKIDPDLSDGKRKERKEKIDRWFEFFYYISLSSR